MRMERSGGAAVEPVSVILPSFNEEGAVAQEVVKIRQVLTTSGIAHEVIVVDDGSSDATAERALAAGARVLHHIENRGYGASIKTGIRAAAYDIIVISDADATYPAEAIPELLAEIQTADMVVGSRTGVNVHIPLVRRPAKWVLNWVATRVAGRSIPDLNSGLRAFRRDCAEQYFTILSNQFSFTSTITLALLADDYRVVYYPISYYPRVGASKIVPRHFMDFLMLVFRMAVLFQPLRVFLPLAFTSGMLGLIKTTYDVVAFLARTQTSVWSVFYLPVLSPSAILLLLLGFQLLVVGMVVDALVRRMAQRDTLVPSRAIISAASATNARPRAASSLR
jgi:glycosyltransferase involved in cell wall biosynthesis